MRFEEEWCIVSVVSQQGGFLRLKWKKERGGEAWPDSAVAIDSPLLRVPRDEGADDQDENTAADAAPQALQDWTVFKEARKQLFPEPAQGSLAHLKSSVGAQLAALECFACPDGVPWKIPAVARLVDALSRQSNGTGLSFLAGDNGGLSPSSAHAIRLGVTKVLRGWERCLSAPSFDQHKTCSPPISAGAQLQQKKTLEGERPAVPSSFPRDEARTRPAYTAYMAEDLYVWSLLFSADKTRKPGDLRCQLQNLVHFVHAWELAHLTPELVVYAVSPWCTHFGQLSSQLDARCVEGCVGGRSCTHFFGPAGLCARGAGRGVVSGRGCLGGRCCSERPAGW